MSDRDIRWSEWIRRNEKRILSDVRAYAERWRGETNRTLQDHLTAIWVKWLLTSTVRHLRDHATLSLYWYGRGDPKALFQLTLSSLQTNDPYVCERLMAASYGVIMAGPGECRAYGEELAEFLSGLLMAFCGDDAKSPTEHWLIREYVTGIVELSRRYYDTALGEWTNGQQFAVPERPTPVKLDEKNSMVQDPVYGLDFKNYTIRGLVSGRGNYEFDHPGYQEVMSWIRGRVLELGWSPEKFRSVDLTIADSRWRSEGRPGRTEAYADKYGWIGYFEAAGRLGDEGNLPVWSEDGRLSDVTIDPSFPMVPQIPDLTLPAFLSSEPLDLQAWVTQGNVQIPDELLCVGSLNDVTGPWVALDGFLLKQDVSLRREVFGFLKGILVRRGDKDKLRTALLSREYPGNYWIPEPPGSYYVFAGEMTWSSGARQGRSGPDLAQLYSRSIEVSKQEEIAVEIPVHSYSWESYHSSVNVGGGHTVPAITLAEAFDLRAMPNRLDWCDPEGKLASLTLSAPYGFNSGNLLYLRDDLIRSYCAKHDYELVWIVWGERLPYFADSPIRRPEWVYNAVSTHSNIWRRVATLNDITLK